MNGRYAKQHDPEKERAVRVTNWRAAGSNPADYAKMVGSIYPKVPTIQASSRFDKVSKKDFVTELFAPEPETTSAATILQESAKLAKETRASRANQKSIFEPDPNPLEDLVREAFSPPQPPEKSLNENLFDRPVPKTLAASQQQKNESYRDELATLADLTRQLEALKALEALGELE